MPPGLLVALSTGTYLSGGVAASKSTKTQQENAECLCGQLNLSFTVPQSSSECWQSDSELGLGGDNPVTAVVEQLTGVCPAFGLTQVSLRGRLGFLRFSVSKELSRARSKAGSGARSRWSLWVTQGAASTRGNQPREGDSGTASPPHQPSQEAACSWVTCLRAPRALRSVIPRIHNPARTCPRDSGLGIISTRIKAALWFQLSVLLLGESLTPSPRCAWDGATAVTGQGPPAGSEHRRSRLGQFPGQAGKSD